MTNNEHRMLALPACDAMVTDPAGKRIFRVADHWFAAEFYDEARRVASANTSFENFREHRVAGML